ncbi:unnamed protein product [Closterium sp. NIES-65]|nr:unnamed protein product [Closterium sp. NIES-65]
MTVAQLVRVLAPSCRGATRNGEHAAAFHAYLSRIGVIVAAAAGFPSGMTASTRELIPPRRAHCGPGGGTRCLGGLRRSALAAAHVLQRSNRSPPDAQLTSTSSFQLSLPPFASPCHPFLCYYPVITPPSLLSLPFLLPLPLSSPPPNTLTHLSHNPLPVPACPPCPCPALLPSPTLHPCPLTFREPAAAPPGVHPLPAFAGSQAVLHVLAVWGQLRAAGRRGRPAATAPPCRASHATLAGNVAHLRNVSAALAHVSAAPAHVSAAPTHVSAAPAHVGAAPAHVGAAPAHVSAAPAHVSAAPAHVSAAPAHASAAPAHVGASEYSRARLPGACQQRVQVLAMAPGASLSSPQYIAPSVVRPRLPSLSLS